MNRRNDNHKVVNLDKVSYASLAYVTHSLGITYKRIKKPESPTVNGHEFDCDAIRHSEQFVDQYETMLEYATRRFLLDTWHPELTLQLSNNHSLIYTGDKALSLWEAWKAKIFGKKGNKK